MFKTTILLAYFPVKHIATPICLIFRIQRYILLPKKKQNRELFQRIAFLEIICCRDNTNDFQPHVIIETHTLVFKTQIDCFCATRRNASVARLGFHRQPTPKPVYFSECAAAISASISSSVISTLPALDASALMASF